MPERIGDRFIANANSSWKSRKFVAARKQTPVIYRRALNKLLDRKKREGRVDGLLGWLEQNVKNIESKYGDEDFSVPFCRAFRLQ